MKIKIICIVLVSVATLQTSQDRLSTDRIVSIIEDLRIKNISDLYPVKKILGEKIGYGFCNQKSNLMAKYDIHKRLQSFTIQDKGQLVGGEKNNLIKMAQEVLLDDGSKIDFWRDVDRELLVFMLKQ